MSEIVERTREDRFEELFREHYRAVRGYALRRAPGDLAQDAVSETFLVVCACMSALLTAPASSATRSEMSDRVAAGDHRRPA